jgi:ATP-dependent Clp protease protease subunit
MRVRRPFFLENITMAKTWYTVKAQGEDSADVDIFDYIGYWGIRAQDFLADLKHLGAVKNIRVRINSYGGEVFDGIAIYNALKRHEASVTVEIYGIAASIASIIAMAGDRVIMPANTFMFIHDPLTVAIGDADDMREIADELEKLASGLVTTYMAKSSKSEKEVKKWMAEDTWFSAADALAAGLADEVTDEVKIAAALDLSVFKNPPAALLPPAEPALTAEQARAEAQKEIKTIGDACAAAGVPGMALEYFNMGLSAAQVQARLADAKAIRDACTAAFQGVADAAKPRADAYIKAGMTLTEVRAELAMMKLRQDVPIDGHLPTASGAAPKVTAVIDSKAIYESRKNWKPKK